MSRPAAPVGRGAPASPAPAKRAGRRSAKAITARWVLAEGTRAKHRAVHDPEALEPEHPAGGVDDRRGVVGPPHAAAADRVVEGLDGAQDVVGIG